MAEVFGIDHRILGLSAVTISAGIAAYSTYKLWSERRQRVHENVYESQSSLHQYLAFHYGKPQEVLKFDFGPQNGLDFPKRCAQLCLKHFKLQEGVPNRALDVGCAVGRSTFELARSIKEVIGIDFSQSFVDTGNTLKQDGKLAYSLTEEGYLVSNLIAAVDPAIDRSRVTFQQGDACALDTKLGEFGCVLAANLICRLHHPRAFLHRLSSLVAPGGIVMFTTPFTWLLEFTDQSQWLGGFVNEKGEAVTGFQGLKLELEPYFTLVETVELPFLIRETARKYQWTVALGSVWRRR